MARHSDITGRYVYVDVNGHEYRIYYEEAGQGIPLVCQHTAGSDGRQYRHILEDEEITSRFRVIAVDLPYHGKSLPPDSKRYWEERYALHKDWFMNFWTCFVQELELEQRLKEEEKINLKEVRKLDDEQKKKRLNGTVKWFNGAKGYGFIKREDKEKDIFVHFSAVKNSGLKYLKEGEQLTFEVEYSDKGPSAINLQKTVNEVFRPHLKVVK